MLVIMKKSIMKIMRESMRKSMRKRTRKSMRKSKRRVTYHMLLQNDTRHQLTTLSVKSFTSKVYVLCISAV